MKILRSNLNESRVERFSKQVGISKTMAEILLNKGVEEHEAKTIYEDATDLFDISSDIWGLNDVASALVNQKDKKIHIFADYDVDGLASGFILNDYLSILGHNVDVYYPKREDGYGLNMVWTEKITKKGKKPTVICVDNGITQFDEIKYLKDHGCEVYVIDHHEPLSELPPADAICDAWVDQGYGTHLCAAAVVWKVIARMAILMDRPLDEINDTVMAYLPFVALATISDIMPACAENRAIIHEGLKAINEGHSTIIKALMDTEGIENASTKDIVWTIAPELNACSRMGHIEIASQFFKKEGEYDSETKSLAADIRSLNRRRKTLTEKAIEDILQNNDFSNDAVIFADMTEYPLGIIGIVAGKLVEVTGKPAVAYQKVEDEDIATGSARAPEGISIKDIINYEAERGNAVGAMGHAMACGVNIIPSKISNFLQDIMENPPVVSTADLDREKTVETEAGKKPDAIILDSAITPDEINFEIRREVNSFGYTAKELPTVGIIGATVEPVPWETSSGKRHILFRMKDSRNQSKYAVMWNGLDEYEEMGSPKKMNLAGFLDSGAFCRYCKDVNLSEHSTMLTLNYMEAAS